MSQTKLSAICAHYLDSELYIASESHARFSCQGREYDDDTLALDDGLRWRLAELEHEPEAYGRQLFAAVFPQASRLREGLREALAHAQGIGHRLRIRLHLAPGLSGPVHGMFWELLLDPDRKVAIGRSPDTALSRYSTVPLALGQPANGRPRLLALVAAPENAERFQMAAIDRGMTHRRLEHAFAAAGMDFEILEPPATPGRLREGLASGDFHVLHIFGHGLIRQRGRQTAALMLENEDGAALPVDEDVLAEIFLGERGLRLVTLVACHGGALSSNDAFSGLAARLVERGIPAVIGMGRAVTFGLGHLFTDHLYRNLARTGRVDVAVNEARQQLYLNDPKNIDWSSPILYMRLPDGLLWTTDESQEAAPDQAAVAPVPKPPSVRPWSWFRQATLALATAVLVLIVWPATEAAADLDLVVSRVAFTLAKKQPLGRFSLRELAAVSLDEIRLPRPSDTLPTHLRRADLGHPLGLILRADAEDSQASLTLQKALVPSGRVVILEHLGSHSYRLSIDRPPSDTPANGNLESERGAALELSAAISGSAHLKMLHHRPWIPLDAGDTVYFASYAGRLDLDVELAQTEEPELHALEITALSLLTVVETPDAESSYFDQVSTIRSGEVVLRASGLPHRLEAREELRFAGMNGWINLLEPHDEGIALRLRGTFADLETQISGGTPRRATVLGLWLGEGPSRTLLVAVIVLLVTLLLSVTLRPFKLHVVRVFKAMKPKLLNKDK